MHFSQDPVTYFVPIFLLLVALEFYISYRDNLALHEAKDTLSSLLMGLGSAVINLITKALAFTIFTYLHQWAIFDIGWQAWAWLILLFADDFTFYWHHRLSHEIRLLWAAHVNHHSSQQYNLSTALRQSWSELLYKYIWWCWLPLLGFDPLMVLTMISFSLIYQFFLHTQSVKKLGSLEYFFNTPSHHRVHHGVNIAYLDRNHGGIFIIWDRLFGTFTKEEEPVIYGITNNINTYNPLLIASHEFTALWHDMKQTDKWLNSLKYALMPPGWTPNDPTKTAKYLQKQRKKQ